MLLWDKSVLMKRNLSLMKEFLLVKGFCKKITSHFWFSTQREVFLLHFDAESTRKYCIQMWLRKKLITSIILTINSKDGRLLLTIFSMLIFIKSVTMTSTSFSKTWSSSVFWFSSEIDKSLTWWNRNPTRQSFVPAQPSASLVPIHQTELCLWKSSHPTSRQSASSRTRRKTAITSSERSTANISVTWTPSLLIHKA